VNGIPASCRWLRLYGAMKPSIKPLRPEALPPVRSALPLVLALATALLAGAIGGFLMRAALPGDQVRVEERIIVTPTTVPNWFFRLLFDKPEPCVKSTAPAAELKLLNSKPL